MAEDRTRQVKLIQEPSVREDHSAEGYRISLSLQTQNGEEHTFLIRVSDLRALAFYIEGPLRMFQRTQSTRMKGATRKRLKQVYQDIAEFLDLE